MADFSEITWRQKQDPGQNFRWDQIPTGRRMLKMYLQARSFGAAATG